MSNDKPYKVGRGKPPKEYQFKVGEKANPAGKSSKQKKAEYRAAELAGQITVELLEALTRAIANCEDNENKLAYLKSETIALMKQSQDRAYGTAKQSIDIESPDGSMTPKGLDAFYGNG